MQLETNMIGISSKTECYPWILFKQENKVDQQKFRNNGKSKTKKTSGNSINSWCPYLFLSRRESLMRRSKALTRKILLQISKVKSPRL